MTRIRSWWLWVVIIGGCVSYGLLTNNSNTQTRDLTRLPEKRLNEADTCTELTFAPLLFVFVSFLFVVPFLFPMAISYVAWCYHIPENMAHAYEFMRHCVLICLCQTLSKSWLSCFKVNNPLGHYSWRCLQRGKN